MTDARTRAFYDTEAHAYAARARIAPHLGDFISALPPGAPVLDLGCGGGQDSAAMRDAGFEVTSLDASPGLAAEAKRLWNINVRVLDFCDLDYSNAFNGAWACGSLHHADADQLGFILERIRLALKPCGILHASLKANTHDRRDKFDRFFCAISAHELLGLVRHWTEASVDTRQGSGYDDEPTPWLMLRARA